MAITMSAIRENKRYGLLAMSLFVIKPHIAVGVFLYAVLNRRLNMIIGSLVLIGTYTLGATLLFGPDIWIAFRSGANTSMAFMLNGFFPLPRMTSMYAFAYPFSPSPQVALAIHVAFAVMVVGAIVWMRLRGIADQWILAASILTGVLISPYCYDYNLVTLSMVLGIAFSNLMEKAPAKVATLTLILSLLATANLQLAYAQVFVHAHLSKFLGALNPGSYTIPLLAILVCLAIREVRRAGARQAGNDDGPGGYSRLSGNSPGGE